MSNQDIITAFINHKPARTALRNITYGVYIEKGRSLTSTGTRLYSYDTCIARWDDENIVAVNSKKYSASTSRVQSTLKWLLEKNHIVTIEM